MIFSIADKSEHPIKKPIQSSLLKGAVLFGLMLFLLLSSLSYLLFSSSLYANYNDKLESVVAYVENNIDADDLAQCVRTGEKSEKYRELQRFLNGMVDDLRLEYLYIIIPSEETMTNVISATSAREREAGEADMELLETTDAYPSDERRRFVSFWNSEGINYFEESSEYGTYYTGCKALRDSGGNTVALICVDLSIDALHRNVRSLMGSTILVIILVFCLFGALMVIWLRRNVTTPLLAIEKSALEFAHRPDIREAGFVYRAPEIRTGNEVQVLGEAIRQMAKDVGQAAEEAIKAEKRAIEAENENLRLEEEARAAAKIAELSQSVSSLLTNMPAMTFSKDTRTGAYLACNQSFAEYAHQETPEGVVGKTDHDIFDQATADHFVEDDKKALNLDKPYTFVESVLDAVGNPRIFQTTKLKFTDTTGRLCLLGMSMDITEMMRIKQEKDQAEEAYEEALSASVTYGRIAQALSSDYTNVFYVDLDTDEYIEYLSGTETLTEERRGESFFAASRWDAVKRLYKKDQEAFIAAFTKENVMNQVEETGVFSTQYRMLVNGEPEWFSMKVIRMRNDLRHIIIGVKNIDAVRKHQEAARRVQEERTTYARISALTGNFICVYTVNPETDEYIEYSATSDYDQLGLPKGGKDFFETARREGVKVISLEDVDLFLSLFTREQVLDEIASSGLYVFNYRLMMQGAPVYVSLKAAMVEEKDGPQLVIGISDISAQVKRDQEYANSLSEARNKANLDALTGVKNKYAYVDVESQLDHQIEEGQAVKFAIVVFDVNDLKGVNDTRGHQAGDRYIQDACNIICDMFKHSPVFRVGGDEFAVIAQGYDYDHLDEQMRFMERHNEESRNGGIIIACGMARYKRDRSVAAVFERADMEMYANKRRLKEIKGA